jgi:hypothetical protein
MGVCLIELLVFEICVAYGHTDLCSMRKLATFARPYISLRWPESRAMQTGMDSELLPLSLQVNLAILSWVNDAQHKHLAFAGNEGT